MMGSGSLLALGSSQALGMMALRAAVFWSDPHSAGCSVHAWLEGAMAL